MKSRSGENICRHCGREIAIIEEKLYRKIVVDAEAVWVRADHDGETFVRVDGTKVKGVEAEIGTAQAEPAYRPHAKTCRGKK